MIAIAAACLLAWMQAADAGESRPAPPHALERARQEATPHSVEIFDGKTLHGWKALGDAHWTVENGELVGEVGGGSQSFLVTERAFGDFVLEVEVKNELPGNSGIQVRSHVREDGRLFGYQIEIDPSERAWSGGLYDEARRGWLQNLEENPAGHKAFKPGEWNRYRIECFGPWIRAWVNDVPTADWLDPLDLEGAIGLQVHAGKDTRVRWRNFRMSELGSSSWKPFDLSRGYRKVAISRDFALRLSVRKPKQRLVLHFRCDSLSDTDALVNRVGTALSNSAAGWSLELSNPALWIEAKEDAVHDIFVLAYGDRVSVLADGKTIARSDAADPARGKMMIWIECVPETEGAHPVREAAFLVRQ